MLRHRPLPSMLIFAAMFAAPALAQDTRAFTTEIALDVKSPSIAAMTEDGRRIAVTVRTRRGRVDVDHARYGDPTYVGPSLVTAMVIDTRSGDRVWLHEQGAQVSDFTWSPDGSQLAYLLFAEDEFTLRVFDAASGSTEGVTLRTSKPIASSSPLVWAPDGESILLTLRPDGWDVRASGAFFDLTDAPIIVQDSRNDFLAWDRVRNIANEQITALVSLDDGAVREILTDVVPQGLGFSPDGSRITYTVATRTKTSYTRRDGTDYGLYSLDLDGGEPGALIESSEDRVSAEWNEDRDAYAFAEEGAVFVHELGEDEVCRQLYRVIVQ